MSKIHSKQKKDTERLFGVFWMEQIVVEAHIWARSPDEALAWIPMLVF